MTRTIDIAEARSHFDELLSAAAGGVEIVIVKDQRPVVRLVRVPVPSTKRTAGLGRGEVWIGEDFDAPLPDDYWTGTG